MVAQVTNDAASLTRKSTTDAISSGSPVRPSALALAPSFAACGTRAPIASNLLAGLAPSFGLLFLFRALLGIGMGAEWPCGAALAMETWPQRSRGFMAGVLQASWGLGALLSSAAYALLYDFIGWRGLLILGVLPALAVVYIRRYVKEPEVWTQNRAIQRQQKT